MQFTDPKAISLILTVSEQISLDPVWVKGFQPVFWKQSKPVLEIFPSEDTAVSVKYVPIGHHSRRMRHEPMRIFNLESGVGLQIIANAPTP